MSANRVLRLLPICVAWAPIAFSGLLHAQEPAIKHDFQINNGLVKRTPLNGNAPGQALPTDSVAAYTAEVQDPQFAQVRRRVELHWIKPRPSTPQPADPFGALVPVLWEPDAQCMTPLRKPDRYTAGFWMIDAAAAAPANADCKQAARIGDWGGVTKIRVLLEAQGARMQYRIALLTRDSSVVHEGELRPSARIAAREEPGYFEEKFLIEFGFRRLDEVYLVTNYGIFKGTDRATSTGGGGFTVVETTDLYRAFRPGDLFYKVDRYLGTPLKMTLISRERTGDGSSCPDTDGNRRPLDIHFSSLQKGVRTWSMESRSPARTERYCVQQRVNTRTCQVMECVQWSDTVSDTFHNEIRILTDSEQHARRIFASLPALTLANSGVKYDSSTYRERVRTQTRRNDSSAPWGECGLEGCDARRRRDEIDRILIDLWSKP